MDQQLLRNTLESLHAELGRHVALDDESKTLLADLKSDIQSLLDHSVEEEYGDMPSLLARLEDAVERFEISHPKLTSAIANVITTLNNLGI
jgi:hypothetical protein